MVEFLGLVCFEPWEAFVLLVIKAHFSHLGDKDKVCLRKEIWNVILACDLADLVTFASCVHSDPLGVSHGHTFRDDQVNVVVGQDETEGRLVLSGVAEVIHALAHVAPSFQLLVDRVSSQDVPGLQETHGQGVMQMEDDLAVGIGHSNHFLAVVSEVEVGLAYQNVAKRDLLEEEDQAHDSS